MAAKLTASLTLRHTVGFCMARARPTSRLGLLVSKSGQKPLTNYTSSISLYSDVQRFISLKSNKMGKVHEARKCTLGDLSTGNTGQELI